MTIDEMVYAIVRLQDRCDALEDEVEACYSRIQNLEWAVASIQYE